MQLFVLKALREGQPKHGKKGRKKFIGSNKKSLKWSDSGLSFVKVCGNISENLQVPCSTRLSQNWVVLTLFPPLARGARLDMLISRNDWFA